MKVLTNIFIVLILTISIANATNFEFSTDDLNKARSATEEGIFYSTLENQESSEVTFNLVIDKYIPDNWFANFCFGGLCVLDSGQTTLEAGVTELIDVHFIPQGNSGWGRITMRIYPDGHPEETQQFTFTYLADVDIIIVDDDGGENYEDYLINSVSTLVSVDYGVWDRSLEGFDEEDLDYCSQVYWMTGTTTANTLTMEDQERLIDFLDNNGGRLFLTGESIGSDINATSFYQSYLKVQLDNPDTDEFNVNGVSGDPITDGFEISISGGTGANNQTKPEGLAVPVSDGAEPIFHYFGSGEIAGTRSETIDYKTVYLAFGFEAIAEDSERDDLLMNIFYWLILPSGIKDHKVTDVPASSKLHQNYPNPFNPETTISFELPNTSGVKLAIYDASGKLVKTLIDGEKEAGYLSVIWDGKDDKGREVSSGVYFYKLKTANGYQTKKMNLLK